MALVGAVLALSLCCLEVIEEFDGEGIDAEDPLWMLCHIQAHGWGTDKEKPRHRKGVGARGRTREATYRQRLGVT